jgi:hypothetical protein
MTTKIPEEEEIRREDPELHQVFQCPEEDQSSKMTKIQTTKKNELEDGEAEQNAEDQTKGTSEEATNNGSKNSPLLALPEILETPSPHLKTIERSVEEINKLYQSWNVLIATPAYAGMVTMTYTTSLVTALKFLDRLGIRHTIHMMGNESLITRARNTMVHTFRANSSFTHILFIDADIGFDQDTVVRLLMRDVEVVGAIYPKKAYDFTKLNEPYLYDRLEKGKTMNQDTISFFEATLVDYVINVPCLNTPIVGGMLEVINLGTGMMLIRRDAIDKLVKHFPESVYNLSSVTTSKKVFEKQEEAEEQKKSAASDQSSSSSKDNDNIEIPNPFQTNVVFDFFRVFVVQGTYLSEDYGFCHMLREAGGKVHADLTIPLTHVGTNHYQGNILHTKFVSLECIARGDTTVTKLNQDLGLRLQTLHPVCVPTSLSTIESKDAASVPVPEGVCMATDLNPSQNTPLSSLANVSNAPIGPLPSDWAECSISHSIISSGDTA